ncbi:hypothetical protein FACHB389_36755 [Nostoc calcicola FACHB-389]|nr:hypothetical protein FACHB389_36755 [Nostoc calcicola FACHB-389]
MIQDLGATITTQFKGEISDIHSKGNLIFFTETLFIGGQRIRANHTIPIESIVIVEAPPILQGDWLAAGVSTLLVPQMKPETTAWGAVILSYCRLIKIHKIEVITSIWSSNSDIEADINQSATEEKLQPINYSSLFSIANLLQNLGWKVSKPLGS